MSGHEDRRGVGYPAGDKPVSDLSEPFHVHVDEVAAGFLTVSISLPGRWMVTVNQPQHGSDEPFTLDGARRLTEAAFAAAWVLL